jgi:hypothetical protein
MPFRRLSAGLLPASFRLMLLLDRRAAGLFLGHGRIGHVSPPGVVRSVSRPMIPAGPVAILYSALQ